MNIFNRSQEPDLSKEISRLLRTLSRQQVGSPEYDKTLTDLERFMEMKLAHKRPSLTPDGVLMAVTHLTGITLIVGHERANLITSKAMAFLGRVVK